MNIKFRCWIKYQKEMKEVLSLDFINNKAYIAADKKNKPFGFIHFDDCELLQYVGTHDKTGIEIFEGDNIRFMYKNVEYIGEIAWDVSMFIICNIDDTDSCIPLNNIVDSKDEQCNDAEIIGNIYQNIDLMGV